MAERGIEVDHSSVHLGTHLMLQRGSDSVNDVLSLHWQPADNETRTLPFSVC
ncbi:hypothetical protein PAMC26510_30210 [Caballeronia sordidicola]|uniref:Uncharacterized protein n=1 Tax=Caballeronia sordidicola TaxID=196367 RepID=A0A242M9F0_CABSO|nr:hypothetical protein PAMC26510_30210 [Caballeronia sordidicola]